MEQVLWVEHCRRRDTGRMIGGVPECRHAHHWAPREGASDVAPFALEDPTSVPCEDRNQTFVPCPDAQKLTELWLLSPQRRAQLLSPECWLNRPIFASLAPIRQVEGKSMRDIRSIRVQGRKVPSLKSAVRRVDRRAGRPGKPWNPRQVAPLPTPSELAR